MSILKALAGVGSNEDVLVSPEKMRPPSRWQKRRRFLKVFPRRERLYSMTPTELEEAQIAGDRLKDGVPVFLNLQDVDSREGQRIVDMLSGVCFALDGEFWQVGDRLFLFAPGNYSVKGDARSLLERETLFTGVFNEESTDINFEDFIRQDEE